MYVGLCMNGVNLNDGALLRKNKPKNGTNKKTIKRNDTQIKGCKW